MPSEGTVTWNRPKEDYGWFNLTGRFSLVASDLTIIGLRTKGHGWFKEIGWLTDTGCTFIYICVYTCNNMNICR